MYLCYTYAYLCTYICNIYIKYYNIVDNQLRVTENGWKRTFRRPAYCTVFLLQNVLGVTQ